MMLGRDVAQGIAYSKLLFLWGKDELTPWGTRNVGVERWSLGKVLRDAFFHIFSFFLQGKTASLIPLTLHLLVSSEIHGPRLPAQCVPHLVPTPNTPWERSLGLDTPIHPVKSRCLQDPIARQQIPPKFLGATFPTSHTSALPTTLPTVDSYPSASLGPPPAPPVTPQDRHLCFDLTREHVARSP